MANKVYIARETPIVFADSAQTPDYNLTLSALAADSGRVSAQADLGAGSKAGWYWWQATIQMATAGVVGEYARVLISFSDNTNRDGEVGASDAALAAEKERNLHLLGHVVVDTTSVDTDITGSGAIFIPSRYFSIALIAPESDALRTNTGVHAVRLTPIPDEVQ